MKADELWKLFAETGSPALYLLYRAVRGGETPPSLRESQSLP